MPETLANEVSFVRRYADLVPGMRNIYLGRQRPALLNYIVI